MINFFFKSNAPQQLADTCSQYNIYMDRCTSTCRLMYYMMYEIKRLPSHLPGNSFEKKISQLHTVWFLRFEKRLKTQVSWFFSVLKCIYPIIIISWFNWSWICITSYIIFVIFRYIDQRRMSDTIHPHNDLIRAYIHKLMPVLLCSSKLFSQIYYLLALASETMGL